MRGLAGALLVGPWEDDEGEFEAEIDPRSTPQRTLYGTLALCGARGCGHRLQAHKVHARGGCQCSCMVSCYYCKGSVAYHQYRPRHPGRMRA